MAGENAPRSNARLERLDLLSGARAGDQSGRAVTRGQMAAQMAEEFGGVAGQVIRAQVATLAADVTLDTSGQWYDGPTIGLSPGTYVITAQALQRNDGAAAASVIQVRIHDGAGSWAASQASMGATDGLCAPFAMVAHLVVAKAKAVKLQMRASVGNANSKMKASAPDAGAEAVATRIHALRIGD